MGSEKPNNLKNYGPDVRGIRDAAAVAALIASLLLMAAAMLGCAPAAPRNGSLDFPIYYLYPGEPAPVEGPQMRARDFERLLRWIGEEAKIIGASKGQTFPQNGECL